MAMYRLRLQGAGIQAIGHVGGQRNIRIIALYLPSLQHAAFAIGDGDCAWLGLRALEMQRASGWVGIQLEF